MIKKIRHLIYRWQSTGDVHRLVNVLNGREMAYMEPSIADDSVVHDLQLFTRVGVLNIRLSSPNLDECKEMAKWMACMSWSDRAHGSDRPAVSLVWHSYKTLRRWSRF